MFVISLFKRTAIAAYKIVRLLYFLHLGAVHFYTNTVLLNFNVIQRHFIKIPRKVTHFHF